MNTFILRNIEVFSKPPEPSLNWDGIFFPNLQGFAGDRIRDFYFRYDLGTIKPELNTIFYKKE